mgnify:CR=1 FL=1
MNGPIGMRTPTPIIERLVTALQAALRDTELAGLLVNKLGLEKGNDVRQGTYRWLTVRVPGDLTEISLEFCHHLGVTARIGLRFNMSLGSCMSWDRYGFNIESGEAVEALRQLPAVREVVGVMRVEGRGD